MSKLFKNEDHYYDQGMREYALPIRIFFYAIVVILYVFTKIMWRWDMDHGEMFEHEDNTGAIIISNHTSMAEVVTTELYLVCHGHRVRPLMKSDFNKNAVVRWLFARLGGIPIDRGKADMKSLRRAQHALQRGEDVLIYPEATRVRSDDQVVEVHGGFALIASMAKADIIPMAVCGFRDITRDGHHIMRPVKTWMRAGERISMDDAPQGLKRKERSQWLEDESVRRMYELRDELRAEHPGRR